jgi:hypothetical protein
MISDSAWRATRSRRSLQRATLLFLAVLAGITVLRAQETTPAAAPPQPPSSSAGTTDPQATSPTAPDDAPPAPAKATGEDDADAKADAQATGAQDGKPAGKVGPTRDRFEPSEKVRADFDVSFPVDI